uniref:Rab-GAP TBC domain-containing protein n=1 Tax=Daucus carota subsp. sativus TaxID=79200 RepID=A0A175YR50_DAUCS
MVKKQLPDWLNSSLWSSNPPPPPADDPSPSDHSPFDRKPVVPVTPPGAIEPPEPVKVEASDPLLDDAVSDHQDEFENGASSVSSVVEDASKQAQLLHEISNKVISLTELRRLASQGIPDGAGVRSAVWKLLLGYLPGDRALWPSELAKKRSQYKNFKDELLLNPILEVAALRSCLPNIANWNNPVALDELSATLLSEIARNKGNSINLDPDETRKENKGLLSRSEISHDEHPLSLGTTSAWNKFFQDTEIIEQIDRDVMRTHPDLHFFSGDSQFAKSNQASSGHEALRSILIIFAKLNPGIRYVQGMNEVLAPLYYVFKNDPAEENASSAEADTFFCFVELISGFRDNFCQQLDNSVVGIRSTITKMSQLLKEHDEELWRHLEVTCKVNPQFYAFRWITLLLTQEFNFADSLHIWDTLLSDPEGPQETLLRVCCAMLILVRRRLLAGDFTSNLKLLQNYPSSNISHLLYVANKLRSHPG